jgi:hypothetical protein
MLGQADVAGLFPSASRLSFLLHLLDMDRGLF